MALNNIHLNKLVRFINFNEKELRKVLKNDISRERRMERDESKGAKSQGGDFYVPFWADAKKHLLGEVDINEATNKRIMDLPGRKDKYNKLLEGILRLEKRYHNKDIQLLNKGLKNSVYFNDCDLTIKTESFLSLSVDGKNRYVYGYLFSSPRLNELGVRLHFYVLKNAFPKVPIQEFRLLDIIGAKEYRYEDYPLIGNEEELLKFNYLRIINQRNEYSQE